MDLVSDRSADGAVGKSSRKKISVFGLGYVGLPVSAAFAARGFEVIGVDVDASVVNVINSGQAHIVEPDLDMLVQAAVSAGKLRATLKPEPADVFIIAVPTPFKEGNKPDLAYVEQPVPPGDWAAVDHLAERSPLPVMLDEGVATLDDIARICSYGGRILAHLKLVKLGGIAPTVAAARRLSVAGVPFMIFVLMIRPFWSY